MAFFPLVGLLIGIFLLSVYVILQNFFSPQITTVSIIGGWILVTGALHLDGFIDTIDGFSSGYDKEGMLKVMEDTHCGAKGVVALIFLIIFKIVLLNEMPSSLKMYSLVFVPVVGRWVMVCASVFCDYARKTEGLGKSFVENIGRNELIVASFILLGAGIALFWIKFLPLMIMPIIATLSLIVYFNKKIGGVTGDILGAMNEIMEIVALLSISLLGIQ
jgi:adenosylcobinamide-GDP ribazoletransferase